MNTKTREKIIEAAIQGKMVLPDNQNVWHIYENQNWFSNEQNFEVIKRDAFTGKDKRTFTLTIPDKNKNMAILLKAEAGADRGVRFSPVVESKTKQEDRHDLQ
ncbi:MAG: hypothetical protein ACYS8Y_14420 [Planctomycetota bacterium]|jgi:hypothetical protein